MTQIAERLNVAVDASRLAGAILLEHFVHTAPPVSIKPDGSPVTEADRRVEIAIRDRILAGFPKDAFLGEEFGATAGDSGYRWIVDPIDGTMAFVMGVPLFGVLIALEYQGDIVLGVLHMPVLDETVYASHGQGAWHVQGKKAPLRAAVCPDLALHEAMLLTSNPGDWSQQDGVHVLDELMQATRALRTWGDCYGYLLVAKGKPAIMIDPIMKLWDAAAILPIIREAGGRFTDWSGVETVHSSQGIAAARSVLPDVLRIINRRRSGETTMRGDRTS